MPLFVEELAHAFSGGLAASGDTVPQTLTQLLRARLGSVGPSKFATQVAVTIGREFDLSVSAEIMAELGDVRAARADAASLAAPAECRRLMPPRPVRGRPRYC